MLQILAETDSPSGDLFGMFSVIGLILILFIYRTTTTKILDARGKTGVGRIETTLYIKDTWFRREDEPTGHDSDITIRYLYLSCSTNGDLYMHVDSVGSNTPFEKIGYRKNSAFSCFPGDIKPDSNCKMQNKIENAYTMHGNQINLQYLSDDFKAYAAAFIAEKQGRLEQALKMYFDLQFALRDRKRPYIAPDNIEYAISRIYYQLGNQNKAMEHAKKASCATKFVKWRQELYKTQNNL